MVKSTFQKQFFRGTPFSKKSFDVIINRFFSLTCEKKESDSTIKITEKTKWVINTSESQKFEIKT